MRTVDLHVHSDKSDGSVTPAGLVKLAAENGLCAFALTDHDTAAGIEEAMEAAKRLPENIRPEVIPGIELSTEYEGKDVHIVGLFIDYEAPLFREQIKAFVDSRILRNRKMCGNLAQAGIDISYEKLLEAYPGSVITRAHYARYLLAHGYVKSMSEAFDRYVGDNTRYYVPREKITPVQAVTFLRNAGGIAILAHPPLYHMSDSRLDILVGRLKEAGLTGIEAIYSTYHAGEERQMRGLAKKYDLCISGGSDFHGAAKPGLMMGAGYGRLVVPEEVLLQLKARLDAD